MRSYDALHGDIFSQQRHNKRITIVLMAVFFLFVILVGISIDIYRYGSLEVLSLPVATLFALGFASIQSFVSYYYGSNLVLRSLGAERLDFQNITHKKLHNVVTEMAIASGLPMPKVYILPDVSPNAFATGTDPANSVVGVTQGLLDTLNRDELSAVVAHEMGHIKSRDILLMTIVTVLLGTVSLMSDWAIRSWRYGGIRTRKGGKSAVHPLILLVIGAFVLLSPIISRIMAMAISRNREYQADALSAQFTRNPLALASALEKISSVSLPLRSAARGTAHLFISDPLKRRLDEKEGLAAELLSTHPPVERRIERLRRMGYMYEQELPDAVTVS